MMRLAFIRKPNIRDLTGGLLLLAAALFYLLTLDNGLRPDELSGGDLITHQYAQVEARPGNAPGYPLYTMFGWLWFRAGRFLLGWALNPIQILSLYSTGWGLASLTVLYFILLKVVDRRWPLAWLLAAFYAATYFFWYYSVTTEQYSSAVFQTLLMIWLAFQWDESPRHGTLLWLAFGSGTMLANMVTTLFILPPLLWLILFRQEAAGLMLLTYLKRPRLVFQAVGLALLPLLSYMYIYIRGTQHPEWRGAGQWPTAWAWFVDFITIRQGRDELAPGLTFSPFFTAEFPGLMGRELTWLVFWGGLLGLACLPRRRAVFLYSTLLIYFIFCWGYRFGNWFQVIIPAYPIFIIGFAAALSFAIRHGSFIVRHSSWVIRHFPLVARHSSFIIHHSSLIILFTLLVYRFSLNLPRANQRDLPVDTGLDPGWAILADHPRPPALIVTDFEERLALQYLRSVWGVAEGITPIEANGLKPDLQLGAPFLYISRRAAALAPEIVQAGLFYPQAAGESLIALVQGAEMELPATVNQVALNFGDSLQLIGWEVAAPPPLSCQAEQHQATFYVSPCYIKQRLLRADWQIALYWQALTNLKEDYTISVRPLLAGQIIYHGPEAVIQDHQPVWGFYPTSQWQPNTPVRDVYVLRLPPAAGSPDAVQIVVYKTTAAGFENLAEGVISLR